MQCLNVKNKEVAALLDEYTKIFGSYEAAYYLISENNGYGLDKAPNGEPSKLFSDLLTHYNGDRVAAIQAKAKTYSKSFKEWFGDWTNPLKPGDIVFGHPAIGKTYSLEFGKYKDKIIDWDVEFNKKRDKWIEDHSNTVKGTLEYKKARNEYLIYPEKHPDYVEFLTKEWERVKSKTKKEGKILFVSPHNLLKMFPQDFNRIINLKDEDFIKRNIERGGKERESKLWKEGINNTISNTTGIPTEYLNENQHFEDYLNRYVGVSKVVDENGEPLVVYHGSNHNIVAFDKQKLGDNTGKGEYEDKTTGEVVEVDSNNAFFASSNNIYNQQATSNTNTGRNQQLAKLLHALYPDIEIGVLTDPNLRGQAQVEGYMAGRVLFNALLENQDTLPHEYAHHYISWFRNSDIVQKGISLFGSEEELVQAIGENSVKALKWYKRLYNWIKGLFNSKQQVLNDITNSFLSGKPLSAEINESIGTFNQALTKPSGINQINKVYDKLILSTKNRINLFTHSTGNTRKNVERLNQLYTKLNTIENDRAVLEFVGYMTEDVKQALQTVADYKQQYDEYKQYGAVMNPITPEKLDVIKKGTIGFYKNIAINLRNLLDDPEVIELYKSYGVYATLVSQLNSVIYSYNELIRQYNTLADRVAKDNIIKAAVAQGSFTVKELTEKLNDNDIDISAWDKYFGQSQYNDSEVIRLMLNKMVQAKYRTHDATLDVGKSLLALLEKVSKKDLKLLYERGRDGKRTGNFIRELNYGQHEADYMEHMLKVAKEFNITIPSDMPFSEIPTLLNPDQFKKWNLEKNKWDSKYTERRFKPEFYDLLAGLSAETLERKSVIEQEIRTILDPTKDEKGKVHRENLSDEDYIKLVSLENTKRNLSNKFNLDGTIKTGLDYKIAKEMADYNKKLRDKVKYKTNKAEWEKARREAKRTLSPEKYRLWEQRNSLNKPNEDFYEEIKKRAANYTKSDKQVTYEEYRQQLLKLYTVDNQVDAVAMPDKVKDLIVALDYRISQESEMATKLNKSTVFEIAEYKVDPEYYRQLELAKAQGRENEFHVHNSIYNKYKGFVPSSAWKKLVPKKEVAHMYMDTIPNSSWIEIDKTSPYYNNNFDETLSEFRQPKKKYYDNTKNFNLVKGDLKVLYDGLVDTMRKANEKPYFITHSRDFRLPQMEGGALTQIKSQSSVFKGLAYAAKDIFTIKDDDVQYNVDRALDPDGSKVMLVPTRYMRKLDNPEALTNDIVGSVIAYYEMASNYEEMSKIAPEMELIVDFLSRKEFTSSKGGVINGQESNTYYKAKQLLEQFVYGMSEDDMTFSFKMNNKEVKVSVGKAISALAKFTRLNGMGNNLNVILTGLFTNKIQSRLDAIAGVYYDNKALAKASKEIQSTYLTAMASLGNPNNKNKVLCFLEWAGTGRSLQETFSKLNQSRWLRALNQHGWWGGYAAVDFATKGKMALAVAYMYKYDPSVGKFVHKNKFMLRYKNKQEGKMEWERLNVTAFDAFDVVDGKLVLKKEYETSADKATLDRIRNTIKQVSTRIDTQFSDLDKSFLNSNAFCKLIFIYRNFLPINFQTKFIAKRHYDYSTGTFQEAQYRAAFNYFWRHYFDKNLIGTLKEMYQNYDELDDFERRLAKRVLCEVVFSTVGLFLASAFFKAQADDDDDDWFKNMLALISVRTAVESRSNLLPLETISMFNSPTAAWGILEHFGRAIRTLFDDPTETVSRGTYKGMTNLERSLIKITPFRSMFELSDPRSKLEYYDNLVSVF